MCGPAAAASPRYEHVHAHQLTHRCDHLRHVHRIHGVDHRVYSHAHVQPVHHRPHPQPVCVSLGQPQFSSHHCSHSLTHRHVPTDLLSHARYQVPIFDAYIFSYHRLTHALSNLSSLSRANRGTCIMRAAQHAFVLRLTPPSCTLLLHQLTPNTLPRANGR